MKIAELIEALQKYNAEARVQAGLSIPTLFINTVANLSIVGDQAEPEKCEVVRIIAATPDARPAGL